MTQIVTPIRRLAAQPTFRRWAVANLFARLPLTMNLLVLVLVGKAVTGSVATGAILAGVSTFAAGACVAVAVVGAATYFRAPVAVLLVLAVGLGVSYAAILGGYRSLLVRAVSGEDLETANAIDAVFVEVAFVVGPALAGAIGLFLPPSGILLVMTVLLVLAVVLTAGLPHREPAAFGVVPAGPAPLQTHGALPI
ncbi:MAG: hypothetical protein ACR2HR_10630 [Euzebya sp.]